MTRTALLWMAAALFALCICIAQSFAYWGNFDPILLKNSATITVIDTQIPSLECAARATNPIEAPIIAALAAGCVDLSTDTLIVPITPGPMWAYLLTNLITPNQLIGHELSHIFRGEFHPPFLSFIERLPSSDGTDGDVSSDKLADSVHEQNTKHRSFQQFRLSGKAADCIFWLDPKKVSYNDLGALARACLK